MLQDAEGSSVGAAGDSFVVHMDRASLNDFPQLGKYDVTVIIREFEPDRLIAWTVLRPDPSRRSATSTATASSPTSRRGHARHVVLRLVADPRKVA